MLAVHIDENGAPKVGYLPQRAKSYSQVLQRTSTPLTCPARLTGVDKGSIGAVLDFEEVRDALGLPRLAH